MLPCLVLQSVSQSLASKPVPFHQRLLSTLTVKLSLLVSLLLTKLFPAKFPTPGYRSLLRDASVPFSRVKNAVVNQALAGGAVILLVFALVGSAIASKIVLA